MIQSACNAEAERLTGFYVAPPNAVAFRGELPGWWMDDLVSWKWFAICFSFIFFLTRATWHMRASVSMIHWELFLSNSITLSAVTPDMYTAHNLPAAPEEVSHSQGGNTRHRHTITQTYSRLQEWHDSDSSLQQLHSDFMSKSMLKPGRWDSAVELIPQSKASKAAALHLYFTWIRLFYATLYLFFTPLHLSVNNSYFA